MTRVSGETNFGVAIGICMGIGEAMVLVFPVLKIRDYFTEFEKKVFFSGLFFMVKLLLIHTTVYLLQQVTENNVDIKGKDKTAHLLGFTYYNIAGLF